MLACHWLSTPGLRIKASGANSVLTVRAWPGEGSSVHRGQIATQKDTHPEGVGAPWRTGEAGCRPGERGRAQGKGNGCRRNLETRDCVPRGGWEKGPSALEMQLGLAWSLVSEARPALGRARAGTQLGGAPGTRS